MKSTRFCGVSARHGTRGPRNTDPSPRNFIYSSFYDFGPSKEECMKRKIITVKDVPKRLLARAYPQVQQALLTKLANSY
jgi:hypothetical protein